MLIKYVLLAIVLVLLVSILYDGFRQYMAKRKEKRTLQSKQGEAERMNDPGDLPTRKDQSP